MLTLRTSLLTSTGLLTSLAATAQATVSTAGPQPVDVLSWITWGAAFIVLLLAVITGASGASAAQRRYTEAAQPANHGPAADVCPRLGQCKGAGQAAVSRGVGVVA
jgi:hypothetical protein